MLTTPTGEDVKDGVLEESHPLGWCAAGDRSRCLPWVQGGHLSVGCAFSTLL